MEAREKSQTAKIRRLKIFLYFLFVSWFFHVLFFNSLAYLTDVGGYIRLATIWEGLTEDQLLLRMSKLGMVLKEVYTAENKPRSFHIEGYEGKTPPITWKLYIYEGYGFDVYCWVNKEGKVDKIIKRG
jgi:hypothetical protein